MEKRYKETIRKVLLTGLQGGLVVTAIFLSPTFLHQLIKLYLRHYNYLKNQGLKKASIKKIMQRLVKEKLVHISEKDGETTISLTKNGEKQVLAYKIDDMVIKTPKIWDKKWRIVAFDIPEEEKIAREVLRNKLKQLGFRKIQKSIWIYPYPCEKEIEFIRNFYDIRSYITIFTTKNIENEQFYKNLFHLSG